MDSGQRCQLQNVRIEFVIFFIIIKEMVIFFYNLVYKGLVTDES